jgi:hypothetical protein
MQRLKMVLCSGLALAAFAQVASAVTIWDESVDGDLSNLAGAPTEVTVAVGTNTVLGSTLSGDRDFFTFTIPDGATFSALILAALDSTDDLGFLALEAGPVVTDITDPANLLGWMHPSAAYVGTDLLDDMALGAGALGFTPPLGPGTYTLWMQQTNPELMSYTFDLIVSAVPEPPMSALMLIAGLGLLAGARRRRA